MEAPESRIDEICDLFEAEWQSGREPDIADWLATIDSSVCNRLMSEILKVDVEYRLKRGDSREAIHSHLSKFGLTCGGDLILGEVPDLAEAKVGSRIANLPGMVNQQFPVRFGDYELLNRIGKGGMGLVFRARQINLNRIVAIKTMNLTTSDEELLRRFKTEAEAASLAVHPGIVAVHDYGEVDGLPFFSMDYVPGETLNTLVAKRSLPNMEIAKLIRSVADAVEFIHQRQIVHRDIKPSNILIDDDGNPRVADFGLAKLLVCESELTRSGDIIGTVEYMAPEQARGNTAIVGPLADVYAIGAVLYYCLTGRSPFRAMNSLEVLRQVVEDEPISPRQFNRDASVDLETICLKCLRKSPGGRYSSAASLREELDRFIRGVPIQARPISKIESLTRWAVRRPFVATTSILSLLLIALSIGGAVYLIQTRTAHGIELQRTIKKVTDKNGELEKARNEANRQRALATDLSYQSDMRLAYGLYENGEHRQVVKILQRQVPVTQIPDLRGPEWHFLNKQCRATYQTFGRHDGEVSECVVLPNDEEGLCTAGADGVIRIWDIPSAKITREIHPQIGAIHGMALARDGRTLAIGGAADWKNFSKALTDLFSGNVEPKSRVHLLDIETGEIQSSIQSHKTTIESIAFSDDEVWIAAGARYEPVQLTRRDTKKTFKLPTSTGTSRNRSVAFSSNSKQLIISSSDCLEVWSLDKNDPEYSHRLSVKEMPPSLCENLGGQYAVSFKYENAIYLFQENEDTPIRRLSLGPKRDSERFHAIETSRLRNCIVAGTSTGRVSAWQAQQTGGVSTRVKSLASDLPDKSFQPHVKPISSIGICKNGDIISGAEDGELVIVRPAASAFQHGVLSGVQINSSGLIGNKIISGLNDGRIVEISIREHTGNTNIREICKFDAPIGGIAISHDEQRVLVGMTNGHVALIDISSGKAAFSLTERRIAPIDKNAVAFSPDDQKIAWLDNDGILVVHDLATNESKQVAAIRGGIGLRFIDGKTLACNSTSNRISFVDLSTKRVSDIMSTTSLVSIEKHGSSLLTSHKGGEFGLVDTKTRKFRVVSRHSSPCAYSTFSATGRTLISMDESGYLQFTLPESGSVYGGVRLSLPDKCGPIQVLCNNTMLVVTSITFSNSNDGQRSDIWMLDLSGE